MEHIKDNPSTNVSELRSLLGFLQYTAIHIHHRAELTADLRRLTKSDVPFIWGVREPRAFETLLSKLRENVTTAYFDPRLKSEVVVDAYPIGISAVLSQLDDAGNLLPITFVSRSLSPTESRYSQIERDALSAVWGCEKLHRFLFGANSFDLISDHRPLLVVLGSPSAKLSARMELWRLRLPPYNYFIRFRPGRDNPADWFSRHPDTSAADADDRSQTVAEEYVNFIVDNTIPKSLTAADIRSATESDPVLQTVIQHMQNNDWHKSQNYAKIKPYFNVREELSLSSDGILLRGPRIVVPETNNLQQATIKIAHEGHQGVVKCKMLLRRKVWFPQIDKLS